MKLLSVLAAAACVVFAHAKHAKNEPLRESPPDNIKAIDAYPVPNHQAVRAVTTTQAKDTFTAIAATEPVVDDIVGRFMTLYAKEVARTSLVASVSSVIKAERTAVRDETVEKELDVDGLGMNFVEQTQSQQYRIFLFMTYQFGSSMNGLNRPYATVMRLTMDCYNTTSDAAVDAAEAAATNAYDEDATANTRLACNVLDHVDLHRRNESIRKIPSFIQREVYKLAPKAFIHNHSLAVIYDAVEAQDLSFNAETDEPIPNKDTIHYVRYRVRGGTAKDCMVAIEHTDGINTVRYHDTLCYEEPTAGAFAAAAVGNSTTTFVLVACIAGAIVAVLLVWRQRKGQRSGYSYVHSNTSKLSHVPVQATDGSSTDAAVAC